VIDVVTTRVSVHGTSLEDFEMLRRLSINTPLLLSALLRANSKKARQRSPYDPTD